MLNQEELDEVRALTEMLLDHMSLSLKTTVFADRNEIQINISGIDRTYLITDNGETLLSLQYIVSKMIRQKVPPAEGLHVVIDSDGYMFRRDQELRKLAIRTVQRVRKERRGITLPPMNPYDRRIIHTEVARSADLDSVSEGDGFFKKITVRRRN